jgi:hypothetical protein
MLDAAIEVVRWETHGTPDLAGRPQAVLNNQIVDDCDFGIAIFWSRLGTATGNFASGSIEEIERLIERRRRVMVYFKTAPIPQPQLNTEQIEALKTARENIQTRGIVWEFPTPEELRRLVSLHLTSAVVDLLQPDRERPSATPAQVLPQPDIRIRAQPAVAMPYQGPSITVLGIRVENHSPMPLYLSNIMIQLKSPRVLYLAQDGLTGERQSRRTIKPGQSFTLNVTKELLDRADVSVDDLKTAMAVDEIGRTYFSNPEEFQAAAKELLK